MSEKNKILVILGPTASGKSDIAVTLAKKFNGEIISADSRQVYKGMDIGTGKITKKEMGGIKHYLLDVANPKRRFTVSEYLSLTEKAIAEILKSGKLPIICGGTGFYIDALLGDKQIPQVPPNPKLRKQLEKKSAEELFKILKRLDPQRAKNIDAKNPRRLVRAIEIAKKLGQVPPLRSNFAEATPNTQGSAGQAKYEALKIGTKIDKEELKNRINIRLIKRIKSGMINEARKLHAQGLTFKRMREMGLEYGALADFLDKKISKKEMIERLQKEISHYAKRQMTWFKRDKNTIWLSPKSKQIEKEVKKFLLRGRFEKRHPAKI